MITSAIQKLTKILAEEQKQGCQDRVVIGGLDKLLRRWVEETKQAAENEAEHRLVDEIKTTLHDYASKADAERRTAIEVALKRLREFSPVTKPGEPTPAPVPSQPKEPAFTLDSPVTSIRGVSTAYARRLARLGVRTVGDLVYLFPRRYDDFSALKTIAQLRYGEEATIIATIWEVQNRESRRGQVITKALVSDGTATMQVTWFNQPYLAQRLQPGRQIVLSGKVEAYLGRLTMSSPAWEPLERELIHTARLVPVYPLTEGIGARWLRRLIKSLIDLWAPHLRDPLPEELRRKYDLISLPTAMSQIHFPDNRQMLEAARRRLCFDEFLLIQLGVLRQRWEWQQWPGRPLTIDHDLIHAFVSSLPYVLTNAQQRALEEILADLAKAKPMSRLLQGDVGSGKTVVATAALLNAVANGAQAAIMAPTEILAEQHYQTISALLEAAADCAARQGRTFPRPVIRLLIGSLSQGEKETLHRNIAAGEVDIVIGTHALIQESVVFKDLALAVIDEQHRFGVNQRAALRSKGYSPHVLVMTATPIPRTLALTIYGDLDLSVIDEMPPGRQRIETRWLSALERERAYNFVRAQVEQGRQAFIICPLVEESEKIEARAATAEYERLQSEIFPDLKLGLLHGRMKGEEKEAIMNAFRRGEYHILVSTAVVEVGIDVPNATVMLVEGANRFGLAQLHQFRGRVGRGEYPSYCLLLADTPSLEGEQRLRIIEETDDGFKLAEEDLKMRGPGEFFGTRQAGLPDLKVARLSDVHVLETARTAAKEIFERDPTLSLPEYQALAQQVAEFWQTKGDLS
ncbi:MAG: ATP-dependent DNA helicase RecG [Chloroflexi bacterium]|nr:ATP-dependent DNA helicase RecG [Chloroflexota bacterium]